MCKSWRARLRLQTAHHSPCLPAHTNTQTTIISLPHDRCCSSARAHAAFLAESRVSRVSRVSRAHRTTLCTVAKDFASARASLASAHDVNEVIYDTKPRRAKAMDCEWRHGHGRHHPLQRTPRRTAGTIIVCLMIKFMCVSCGRALENSTIGGDIMWKTRLFIFIRRLRRCDDDGGGRGGGRMTPKTVAASSSPVHAQCQIVGSTMQTCTKVSTRK